MTEAQEERTASVPMCINSAEEEYESTPVAVLGPLCITAIAALLIRAGPQHTEGVRPGLSMLADVAGALHAAERAARVSSSVS